MPARVEAIVASRSCAPTCVPPLDPSAAAPSAPAAAPKRQAALVFVFITIVLDVLAMGIVIPVLPKLIESFEGGDTAAAARIYGVFGAVWALMQFVFMPVLGSLSDRYGRRPVLLVSLTGHGLDFALMALAPNLWWLFVGRVISGITSASYSVANAYIADVTPPEERARAFGLIGAAFGVGFVLGPVMGGVLGEVDPRLPFWVAAGLTLANAAYGFFVLPESLPPEKRAPFSLAKANPFGSMRFLYEHGGLLTLAAVVFVINLAHYVLQSVSVLYMGYRYGFSEQDVGFVLAGVGVCSLVVQGGLVGPFVKRFGERAAITVGYLGGAAGFLIYALAPTWQLYVVGVPLMSLWGLAGPTIQGIMTKKVEPQRQGLLQGALSGIMGIAGMIGPLLYSQIFAWSIAPGTPVYLPGLAFLVSAALILVALALALHATRPSKAA